MNHPSGKYYTLFDCDKIYTRSKSQCSQEEIVFKKISTGALSDLEKITKQARAMIAFFGLNEKIGNVTYYDSSGQDSIFTKPYSEHTAQVIDEEIKKITQKAYMTAKKILQKK